MMTAKTQTAKAYANLDEESKKSQMFDREGMAVTPLETNQSAVEPDRRNSTFLEEINSELKDE